MILSVSISAAELKEIDVAARKENTSRSEFMRDASLDRARRANRRESAKAVA